METYNHKNKFQSKSVQQVTDTKSTDDGYAGRMVGEIFDDKEKSIGKLDYELKCAGDNFYVSMNSMLSNEQMKAYTDMDVSVDGDFLELPSNLSAGMDLLVLASHREGLPNVMLEAMACGTPVVGTRVGDVPRIQPDELFTAPPKDVDALFAVLCFALAYGADGVAANRQRVQETYGLQQCIEAYAELHKRLLEQP